MKIIIRSTYFFGPFIVLYCYFRLAKFFHNTAFVQQGTHSFIQVSTIVVIMVYCNVDNAVGGGWPIGFKSAMVVSKA